MSVPQPSPQAPSEEILWRHIRALPYFRGMLRSVEDSFYQGLELPGPILDLGSGDGHFASVAFPYKLDVGLDPWWAPLVESKKFDAYRMRVCSDGAKIPFQDGYFGSVVSTSVLEHIPHIQEVLDEAGRVTRPGGRFVFCVPNDRFPRYLLGTLFFRKLGLHAAADWYGRLFNRISRHQHTDPYPVWCERLQHAGFRVVNSWSYFTPESLRRLEAGHALSLPALFWKKLTGEWVLVKSRANLWFTYLITRPAFRQRLSDEGVCTFYITERM